LDVCYRLKLLHEKDLKAGKERVGRIVSMLVKRRAQPSVERQGQSQRVDDQVHFR
jgi:hypothetical protein